MVHRYNYGCGRSFKSCEHCEHPTGNPENEYGEIVCNDCLDNSAEAAWERFCEAFHGGEIKTLREQQIQAQKFK
jgi:hypothetical protein